MMCRVPFAVLLFYTLHFRLSSTQYTTRGTTGDEFSIDLTGCDGEVLEYMADIEEMYGRETDNSTEYVAVYGRATGYSVDNSTTQCSWTLSVPDHLFLFAVLRITLDPCDSDLRVTVTDNLNLQETYGCDLTSGTLLLSSDNRLDFHYTHSWSNGLGSTITDSLELPQDVLVFAVHFKATDTLLRHKLTVAHTTPLTGYITTPGFDGSTFAPRDMAAVHFFQVPHNHSLIMSFPYLDPAGSVTVEDTRVIAVISTDMYLPISRPVVLHAPFLLRYTKFYRSQYMFSLGFKASFSILPEDQTPIRNDRHASFNCSVAFYNSFQQHVHCNMWPECVGGEDEGRHCSYSHPGCNGSVGYGHKCYSLHGWDYTYYGGFLDSEQMYQDFVWPEQGSAKCEGRGGSLAMMKTGGEWKAFLSIFQYFRNRQPNILLGLQLMDKPDFYRHALQWLDGTVAYDVNFTFSTVQSPDDRWMYFHSDGYYRVGQYVRYSGKDIQLTPYACQFLKNTSTVHRRDIQLPSLGNQTLLLRKPGSLVQCPSGHWTHDFLSCDPRSACGVDLFVRQCKVSVGARDQNQEAPSEVTGLGARVPHLAVSVYLFECEGEGTVPFTLVCDFRQDCADGSDEDWCRHRDRRPGFTCTSGQCVSRAQVCDSMRNCLDGSDEQDCQEFASLRIFRTPPPAVVNFGYGGTISQTRLQPSDPCPETHFRCPGESDYCLPVYVRCNGVYDCVGHEDEADCQNYTCPGFYRCRASSVCVHLVHLCDGWPQCPQRDDELLCSFTCPQGCGCQGLAFICPLSFSASQYPELRYLDATGSGMTLPDFADNFYLIWLRLSANHITSTTNNTVLPNLQTLDISDNHITSFSLETAHSLPRLKQLILSGNPLTAFTTSDSQRVHTFLTSLDLSHTSVEVLDTEFLSPFPQVQVLNVSHGKLSEVADGALGRVAHLQTLDLRGSQIRQYPTDLFRGLTELQEVYADNYDLCCRALLPQGFDQRFCFAPDDEISSCEDLLRSSLYRIFLWLITLSAVTGNLSSFLFRVLAQRSSSSAFNLFVTNLSVADAVMGIYLCIIGVADQVYVNSYILHKPSWTASGVCQAAGFLSLLSSEVSAFMICLITLDRFLVLRFPFSPLHFRRSSAALACCVAWLLGLVLAGVPLLPVTSYWEFYGQTGICLPLPITRRVFAGWGYSFGVMIVLNFVLFLLIAIGQASIYRSVRINSISSMETSRKSQDLTIARRLITVAVSDFVCWFPIGLLGLMAAMGVPVPGELNVLTAIFVLPLNSALNPFLYTYNVLAEKRRKAREAKLMKLLEDHVKSETTDVSAN